MVDVELEIEKDEIESIFNNKENNVNFKNIKEEIEEILKKISSKTLTASLIETNEEKIQFLLLYIKTLYEYLLKTRKINIEKIYSSITIVNLEEIRIINNENRNIDKPTDVLSFPAIEKENIKEFIENTNKDEIENLIFFGDIVICLDKIIMQANEYGHSFVRELSYLLIHSFLHLLGYDHIEKADEVLMREKEEEILNLLEIKR